MYRSISILTGGETREAAQANAFAYVERLVDQEVLEYCDTETGNTHKLASELGQQATEAAMQASRDGFMQAIQVARLMLRDFTDEEIYQERFADKAYDYIATREQFTRLGTTYTNIYSDTSVWNGAIMNEKELQVATSKPDGLWITSLDCHD